MGCDVHVLVTGADHLLHRAHDRLSDLDARWSRFRADSELCRLNDAAGRGPVGLTAETAAVIGAALTGWTTTGGLFDPTVLDALLRAGYDRTFRELQPATGDDEPLPPAVRRPSPGCAGIVLRGTSLTLPAGVHLDLGAVAKGFAADLVVRELLADGALGACVNLGGDVRVAGTAPDPYGWVVSVADPHDDAADLMHVALRDGGVATSGRLRRRWRTAGGTAHHLIDPVTGAPATGEAVAATVIADSATTAEIWATAALLAGPNAIRLIADAGCSGLVVDAGGAVQVTADLEEFVTWTGISGGISAGHPG